jgi:hypothetical protein
MKMDVFLDVAPCSQLLTDVSEEFTAFIIRVIIYHITRCNVTEDRGFTERKNNVNRKATQNLPTFQ